MERAVDAAIAATTIDRVLVSTDEPVYVIAEIEYLARTARRVRELYRAVRRSAAATPTE